MYEKVRKHFGGRKSLLCGYVYIEVENFRTKNLCIWIFFYNRCVSYI